MSDKEPRKRKKKREGQKRDDLGIDDSTNLAQKFDSSPKDADQDSEEEVHTVPHHEPSIIAKIIFLLLSSLLVVATGTIFLALRGADRGPIDVFETSHVLEIPPSEGPEIYVETGHIETLEGEEEAADVLERWQEKLNEFSYEEHSEELIPTDEDIESKQESFIEQSIPVSDYIVEDEKLKYQEIEELEDSVGEVENDVSTPFTDTYEEEVVHIQHDKVDEPQDDLVRDSFVQETLSTEKTSQADDAKENKIAHSADEASFEDELSSLIEATNTEFIVEETLPFQSPELIETTEHSKITDEITGDSQQKESEDNEYLTFKELPELVNEEEQEERILETKTKDVERLTEESEKDFPPVEILDEPLNQKEPVYEKADITNEGDFQIRDELDDIDEMRNRDPDEDEFYFWHF